MYFPITFFYYRKQTEYRNLEHKLNIKANVLKCLFLKYAKVMMLAKFPRARDPGLYKLKLFFH